MYLRTLIETGAHRVGEECYRHPNPVCKFTHACLPANLRAGIKLPLSCTVLRQLHGLVKQQRTFLLDSCINISMGFPVFFMNAT